MGSAFSPSKSPPKKSRRPFLRIELLKWYQLRHSENLREAVNICDRMWHCRGVEKLPRKTPKKCPKNKHWAIWFKFWNSKSSSLLCQSLIKMEDMVLRYTPVTFLYRGRVSSLILHQDDLQCHKNLLNLFSRQTASKYVGKLKSTLTTIDYTTVNVSIYLSIY